MRLGGQKCRLLPGSLAHLTYGKDVIIERHRHRYEFNNRYREVLEAHGLIMSGISMDGKLVEVVEIASDTRGSSPASSIRNSPRRRATGIRCSPAFVRAALAYRPARLQLAPGAGRRLRPMPEPSRRKRGNRAMKLCGFRGRPRPAAVPDRRPLRHRERELAIDTAGRLQRDHRVRSVCRSSTSPPSTRPTVPRTRVSAGPGLEQGLRILEAVRSPDRRAGAHRRPRGHARWPRWPPSSTCCRRRPSCAGRPTSSRMSRARASR